MSLAETAMRSPLLQRGQVKESAPRMVSRIVLDDEDLNQYLLNRMKNPWMLEMMDRGAGLNITCGPGIPRAARWRLDADADPNNLHCPVAANTLHGYSSLMPARPCRIARTPRSAGPRRTDLTPTSVPSMCRRTPYLDLTGGSRHWRPSLSGSLRHPRAGP